jgi:mRNA interferase MazF
MAIFHPGELVLLAFPYADTLASKRRPALILFDAGDLDFV